jgi:lysophospholipase L1-like esterase
MKLSPSLGFLPLRLASAGLFTMLFSHLASAEIAVKSGEKIAFLGDSITQGGWQSPVGYVRLVIAGLGANGVQAEPVPAGISGHKSNDMLARLDHDVLSKHPQWMTLSCGVNDVWHGKGGVPLDDAAAAAGEWDANVAQRGTYKKNIAAIVDQAQAAGIQVVMLTATVIQENLDGPENAKLAPFNDYLRSLAQEKKLRLADLNAMFHERIKAENKPGQKVLTGDGVHMNPEGDKVMATGILKALGADDAQLKKAQESWVTLATEARAAADAKAKATADAEAKAKAAPETK